jgi:hypothetical protein
VKRRSAIAVANERVSIITACRLVGMDVPEDLQQGRSGKVRCPFGHLYHSDHGVEPAMRLYPESNSAWCFSCSTYYTPVTLVARAFDQRYETAAAQLLQHIGYKPVTLAQAWAQVVERPNPPQRRLLAEALKTYCRRVDPRWEHTQFHPGQAAALDRCLALLDHVETDEHAAQWLDGCKAVMRRCLHQLEAP